MVAKELGRRLGDEDIRLMNAKMLLHPEEFTLDVSGKSSDERIFWAFPTYSWGIPPVVVNYMVNVSADDSVKSARHYMLTTCGDDIGYADRQWRKIMKVRGWDAAGAFTVQMPNTYVCMKGFDVDSPELEKEKLSDAPKAIEKIAEAIRDGGKDILIRKSFSWVKTYFIYPWFKKYAMSPKPFHSTDICISCGKCAASCPMDNIVMKEGHPKWDDHCAMCLRCYHICPVHAVEYGKATKGKGQYKSELRNLCNG